jgi:hypothetical protein
VQSIPDRGVYAGADVLGTNSGPLLAGRETDRMFAILRSCFSTEIATQMSWRSADILALAAMCRLRVPEGMNNFLKSDVPVRLACCDWDDV